MSKNIKTIQNRITTNKQQNLCKKEKGPTDAKEKFITVQNLSKQMNKS